MPSAADTRLRRLNSSFYATPSMRNRYVLVADMLVIVVAAVSAFVLRFDWFLGPFRTNFILYAVAAVLVKPVIFHAFGLYARYWRYASIGDVVALLLAVAMTTVAMGALVGASLLFSVIEEFSRSVILIDALLTLFGTGAFRLSIRVIAESRTRLAAPAGVERRSRERRVLIAGAGDAGAIVARELQRNPQMHMVPVGFVDDDAMKIGKRIYGLPVFGSIADTADVVKANDISEVTIAMPTAAGRTVRAVAEACREAGVQSRTIPGVFELLDGQISVSRLRKVEISDLLRRSQVDGTTSAADYITGRRVLVTGAGGSIGLELCRQVARRGPAQLTLLGHGENSLFEAYSHLRHIFPALSTEVVVCDIRDQPRVSRVFSAARPEVVFHAAAHKHVGLMEANPEEAVSNNILGTKTIVDASLACGANRFVLISTDKAVNPSSMMGACKRFAESIVHRAARASGRSFVVVRFGNVLGSRGSAVPIFTQQIERGGPVTITHPEMRRFFMTIPEAVHLVMEAGGLGRGAGLFVLRMGEPIRIVDLVQDLIRLSRAEAEEIPIVYTGIQPGEKLEEALWDVDAQVDPTRHPDVCRVTEAPLIVDDQLDRALSQLSAAVDRGDRLAIETLLASFIPTFRQVASDASRVLPTPTNMKRVIQ